MKSVALFSAIGLLTLAGCSSSPQTTASQPTETSTTSVEIAQSPMPQAKYADLLTVVTNTKAAVAAGDFNQAQQAFDQFEGGWSQVEDGIKAKSADSYNAIEENMDQVTTALRSSNQENALSALQSLNENIHKLPQ